MHLGDEKLITVTLKYLGYIFDSTGGSECDINNQVKL